MHGNVGFHRFRMTIFQVRLGMLIVMFAFASWTTSGFGQSATTQPAPATTEPSSDTLSLSPTTSPETEVVTLPSGPTVGLLAHSNGDIDQALKEVHHQAAGIFPNGPTSLVYPGWKKVTDELREKYGLDLGTETDFVYQGATGGPGMREAGGGYTTLFGRWLLAGKADDENVGYLKFKATYQWQIGDQAPAALGKQIGSLWKTSDSFSENAPQISQLFWDQRLFNNVLIIDAGKLDPTNYYVTNLSANDKQFFMSDVFSGIPAVGAPRNGLGMNAKFSPVPWFYLSAGFQEQEGTTSIHAVNDFFSDFDVFSSEEVGLCPDVPGLGKGNYRFTFWHAAGIPDQSAAVSDQGYALSFDQFITQRALAFSRFEYDKGDLTGFRQLATAGFGYEESLISKEDIVGLGAAYGAPSKSPFRNQYGAEAFYRVQLAPAEQLSFGYELMVDPSFSPNDHVVGVFWTRFRILF